MKIMTKQELIKWLEEYLATIKYGYLSSLEGFLEYLEKDNK